MKELSFLFFIVCQLSFRLVKADVTCYEDFEHEDARRCYDSHDSIAYCCEIGDDDCCYYTNIWSVWYFWFGIIMFVTVFSACMAACCRSRGRQRQQQQQQEFSTAVVTVTSQQHHYRVPEAQPIHNSAYQEFPPSYENVQKSGIPTQFQQYSQPCVIPGEFPIQQPHPPTSYPAPTKSYPTTN